MLVVKVLMEETYDEKNNEFHRKEVSLRLEHSLISLKKWEEKWKKSFLNTDEKTFDEVIDYIKCMTINEVDDEVYKKLSIENIDSIVKYIQDPMTATTITNHIKEGAPRFGGKKEIITAEVIYYWMITLNVPMECQKWHLNQLLTLINVINAKEGPKTKIGKKEDARQRSALNAARRAKRHSKG